MSAQQESTPWYRTPKKRNVVIAVAVVALGLVAVAVATGVFSRFFVGNPDSDGHYSELERHRAQQASGAAPSAVADTAQPSSDAAPAAQATPDAASSAQAGGAQAKSAGGLWAEFRGPGRNGRYDASEIKTDWAPEGLPLLWKQPVGGGYASFVAADGVAYTIEQRRNQEVVAAYDIQSGREIWTNLWDAAFIEQQGDGPRATPTLDSDRIYALGATGELRCLQAKTGKLVWSRNILTENQAQNLEWGVTASPLIVDDKVIVVPGGTSGKSVVAYNKMNGEPVWKSLSDKQSYTSPMLVQLAGKRQILVVSASRAVGLTVEDGSLLWEYPWSNSYGINVSQPIVISDNRFFISAGYSKGAAVVEIAQAGRALAARTVWENISMKNKFNSSVLHNGYVYGLDEGILTCLDVATGERKWKGGRYGYGQVLLAGNHLIISSDQGEVALVKAAPDQHTEVARFAALEGKTWNYPAIVGGRLLVRNQTQMACYDLSGR